jgi:nitronate monooxygenase
MAGGWTTPALVAAVCNAGGLGVLAAARTSTEQLRESIRATRSLTDRPFGVNFLLAGAGPGPTRDTVAAAQRFFDRVRETLGLPTTSPDRAVAELSLPASPLEEQLEVVFEARVPVLSVGMGDPGPLVERAHAAGARVVASVTTVDEARRVADEGVDVIVAQGAEAGGHRSTFDVGPSGEVPLVGTLVLVPQVVDAVRVPVVAAGGIMDGRGLVAALALGAAGVQLGTRFLVARESGAFPAYRERLLAATEVDTLVTDVLTGRPARALRNALVDEYRRAGPPPIGWMFQAAAADDVYRTARARGDAEWMPLLAGQGLRMLTREQGAAEIVAEIAADARALLKRLCAGDTDSGRA